MEKSEAERGAEAAFRAVLEYGPKIELDHHLVYHARAFLFSLSLLHPRLWEVQD